MVLSGENGRQKLFRLRELIVGPSEGGPGKIRSNGPSVAQANLGLGLGMALAPDLDWFKVQNATKHLEMRNGININQTMGSYGISTRLKGCRILNYW